MGLEERGVNGWYVHAKRYDTDDDEGLCIYTATI